MGLTTHVRRAVNELQPGDIVRFDGETEWVEVVKVKADRQGYDMLFTPFNQKPRWRGFDDGDTVERKEV